LFHQPNFHAHVLHMLTQAQRAALLDR